MLTRALLHKHLQGYRNYLRSASCIIMLCASVVRLPSRTPLLSQSTAGCDVCACRISDITSETRCPFRFWKSHRGPCRFDVVAPCLGQKMRRRRRFLSSLSSTLYVPEWKNIARPSRTPSNVLLRPLHCLRRFCFSAKRLHRPNSESRHDSATWTQVSVFARLGV